MVLWKYLKAQKYGLPDSRGSLADEVPSCAIEHANPEIQQLRRAKESVDLIRSMYLNKT